MDCPDESGNAHDAGAQELKRRLDAAGRFCQPRSQGWDTLVARLPPRQVQTSAAPGPQPPGRALHTGAGPSAAQARAAASLPSRARVLWLSAAILLVAVSSVGLWKLWQTGQGGADLPQAGQPPGGSRPDKPSASGPVEPPAALATSEQQGGRAVAALPAAAVEPAAQLAAGCRLAAVNGAHFRIIGPRRVRLEQGELYVEIDRQRAGEAPFVVETPGAEAKAVGTRFVVETRSLDAASRGGTFTDTGQGDVPMASRFPSVRFLTRVLVLAGVVQLVSPDLQVEGGAGDELKTETVQQPRVQFYAALPGYWMLQNAETRKEIELVPEQAEKLEQIAQRYQQQLQDLYAPLRNRDISQEERTKLFRELSEKSNALLETTKKEIEAVLLPHQIEALKIIELRTRAAAYLRSPAVLERLGLTDEQKEKIRRNREELAEKLNQLQKEYFEEILQILTPEQIEKLKQPFSGGGATVVGPQGASGAIVVPGNQQRSP